MTRVLVVEDEPALAGVIRDNLVHEGYQVDLAADGRAGLEAALRGVHDLVILDIVLPGLSGLDLLRELRRSGSRAPVIVVSARSQEADVVVGLELGADDYVTKPFGVRELVARIRALLRRTDGERDLEEYRTGPLRFDFRRRRIERGRKVHALSHTENEILRFLVRRRGVPVSRTEILDEVWGRDAWPTDRTVDNFIRRLRTKIEADPADPRFILTVHRTGYQFVES